MIITGEEILHRKIILPCEPLSTHAHTGFTYGASAAGYDIRIRQNLILRPDEFKLASSLEHFTVPRDLLGVLYDKSTLARMGIFLGLGVLQPGWYGHLTLEIKNQGHNDVQLVAGQPIAHVVFHRIDREVAGYDGHYQNQADAPVQPKRK
jgi:dCTP deaminase